MTSNENLRITLDMNAVVAALDTGFDQTSGMDLPSSTNRPLHFAISALAKAMHYQCNTSKYSTKGNYDYWYQAACKHVEDKGHDESNPDYIHVMNRLCVAEAQHKAVSTALHEAKVAYKEVTGEDWKPRDEQERTATKLNPAAKKFDFSKLKAVDTAAA